MRQCETADFGLRRHTVSRHPETFFVLAERRIVGGLSGAVKG
jgi:hypothetical protein